MASKHFLKKIEDDLLTCNICCEILSEPRLLECQHVVCFGCLQTYVKKTSNRGTFQCPYCKTKLQIPLKGIEGIPKFRYIDFIKDTLEGATENCKTCSKNRTTYLCMECSASFCLPCLNVHADRSHDVQNQKNEMKLIFDEQAKTNSKLLAKVTKEISSLNEEFQKDIRNLQKLTRDTQSICKDIKKRQTTDMRDNITTTQTLQSKIDRIHDIMMNFKQFENSNSAKALQNLQRKVDKIQNAMHSLDLSNNFNGGLATGNINLTPDTAYVHSHYAHFIVTQSLPEKKLDEIITLLVLFIIALIFTCFFVYCMR